MHPTVPELRLYLSPALQNLLCLHFFLHSLIHHLSLLHTHTQSSARITAGTLWIARRFTYLQTTTIPPAPRRTR